MMSVKADGFAEQIFFNDVYGELWLEHARSTTLTMSMESVIVSRRKFCPTVLGFWGS